MLPHRCEVRVRYADTDQGGVVYNANYLVFFEVGRTEMMRTLGVPYARLEDEGTIMPVVEAHVNYHAPARYDDLLIVESAVTETRRVRVKIETSVIKAADGRLLARGWVWLAATGRDGRPRALPPELVAAIDAAKTGNSG